MSDVQFEEEQNSANTFTSRKILGESVVPSYEAGSCKKPKTS